ncbi:MAG: hypothetical protein FWC89_05310 [Defluviitaleaceae bacterium]|nr:hypothetical protein [Defluviitaleaceae bacterium]
MAKTMGNEVIIRNVLYGNTFGGTVWRCLGLLGRFVTFMFPFTMLIGSLLPPFEWDMFIISLALAIPLTYFFGSLFVAILQGRILAVISEDGIAIKKTAWKVIPWESILDVGTGSAGATNRGKFHYVFIKFTDINGDEHNAGWRDSYVNYDRIEILRITKEFRNKHEASE